MSAVTTHRLPEDIFTALASGAGGSAAVRQLTDAEHSKHLMLLHVISDAIGGADAGAAPAIAAFQVGYRLLTAVQAAEPAALAWVLGLPQIGGWAHDSLIHLDQGESPDFAYLAIVAAAAAVRAGVPFELDVPVRDGRVLLPGLGSFDVKGQVPWIRLCSDGTNLTAESSAADTSAADISAVGTIFDAACALLIPDAGTASPPAQWRGTPLVRASVDGHEWCVLLETADRYLDRYSLPMSAPLTAAEQTAWRQRIQAAWQLLVEHHDWAAGPIADGVSVIVPLTPRRETDLDSATTPAAFGAIATSWPPEPVILAETLVHEFQHLKLSGLMDMVPLLEPCTEKAYAPWRPDPRPVGSLLQGVYAHLGVALFWHAQRQVEVGADEVFRAQVLFDRWRATVELTTATLLRTGCLTPAGVRFVAILRERGQRLAAENVPVPAREVARETALDHWLTWQLRHTATDPATVAELAATYLRGEPHGELPPRVVEDDTRKVDDADVRSRVLSMRYLEPWRYRDLCTAGVPGLSEADVRLVLGEAREAADAYRDAILAAVTPQPEAWTGLALALYRLEPWRRPENSQLPLMFDVHTYLAGQGMSVDPLELAAWFG
jgi:HEXXH motif-containing protein